MGDVVGSRRSKPSHAPPSVPWAKREATDAELATIVDGELAKRARLTIAATRT